MSRRRLLMTSQLGGDDGKTWIVKNGISQNWVEWTSSRVANTMETVEHPELGRVFDLYLYLVASSWGRTQTQRIDFTDYTKMYIECYKSDFQYRSSYFGLTNIAATSGSHLLDNPKISFPSSGSTVVTTIQEFDISNVVGSYSITMLVLSGSRATSGNLYIKNLYLE